MAEGFIVTPISACPSTSMMTRSGTFFAKHGTPVPQVMQPEPVQASQAHVKLPRSEIDVIPPQRQQLTTAKTGCHRESVQSLQPLIIDHIEQTLSLRHV
jgi:hypothetical protein